MHPDDKELHWVMQTKDNTVRGKGLDFDVETSALNTIGNEKEWEAALALAIKARQIEERKRRLIAFEKERQMRHVEEAVHAKRRREAETKLAVEEWKRGLAKAAKHK